MHFWNVPRHKICQGKWATGCILWVMLRTLTVLLQELTACSPCILYLALGRLCRLIPVYCQGKNNGCWNSLADNKRFSRLINIHRPAILYLKVVLKNGVNPGIKNLNIMSECLPHVNLTRSITCYNRNSITPVVYLTKNVYPGFDLIALDQANQGELPQWNGPHIVILGLKLSFIAVF